MRGSVTQDMAQRCAACLLRPEWCYCDRVPEVRCQTRIVILRHWKERYRTSNTGRLVQMAIPGTRLLEHGDPDAPLDLEGTDLSGAALLFPGGDQPAPPPRTLVVVDGSWPQARKMVQRVPGLARLPRLSLPPPARSPTRIRRPPRPDGMATIEAVARAVDLLEGPGTGAPLDALFADVVHTLHRLRGKVRPLR